MRKAQHSYRKGYVRFGVRAAAAFFVLFTIAADLVADSRCHSPARTQAAAGTQTSTLRSVDQDPCRTGCVPDCYCCSQTVTCGPVSLPPDAGPVVHTVPPLAAPPPSGVRPVPYRPPLSIA